MKKRLFLIQFFFFAFLVSNFLLPSKVWAGACDTGYTGYERVKNTLLNAEKFTIGDLGCFVGGFVEILLLVAWIAAVIWIIVSGIQYGLALGDPEKMVAAKKSLLWAVIGLIITLSAYAIMVFIEAALT